MPPSGSCQAISGASMTTEMAKHQGSNSNIDMRGLAAW